jgi:hypothetical protein
MDREFQNTPTRGTDKTDKSLAAVIVPWARKGAKSATPRIHERDGIFYSLGEQQPMASLFLPPFIAPLRW